MNDAQTLIDWGQVETLRSDMEDGFDEVVEIFLEEMGDLVNALCPSGDNGATFHAIKGSASNLGFKEVTDLAATLEKTSLTTDDLEGFKRLYATSKGAFLAAV